eukprot:TRINITY_DN43762_c0_g1_i1.p1 TRINITY_DN43762_c0_g1~~TRINITY_DN43762_c0_g1_i1.p1  ORF type:complete len:115 (-),score=25.43 TRINITY_DN43762_c0_g1_i1:101-445(-)
MSRRRPKQTSAGAEAGSVRRTSGSGEQSASRDGEQNRCPQSVGCAMGAVLEALQRSVSAAVNACVSLAQILARDEAEADADADESHPKGHDEFTGLGASIGLAPMPNTMAVQKK